VLFVLCNTYGTLCPVNYYVVACRAEKWDLWGCVDLQMMLNAVCSQSKMILEDIIHIITVNYLYIMTLKTE